MSDEKRTWYQRTHQFTPYTKADGTAVSDEFDAIQASFERIPAMRDDGKGFATSPLIPEPSDPNHPVPFKMLTETEASVNNARDDVIKKAQQVASAAQEVAKNTQITATNTQTAQQAATSALSNSQSADESENMARKWASNPENEVVLDEKYSAYHYAQKAAQLAVNLASAESSATQSATIATQKAEEATQAAKKAESLAVGEVDYAKVLNVPRSNINTEGIVRLTNDTGLESESLALTAKAGKKLAQLIATVQLALNNYIPLNKRSSAVNSNDENNVATSKAVKTAYDKGVEAKNAADNAQSSANSANNNANGRVSKSGDTMTGDFSLKQGDYSGLNVYNNDGYYTRLEGNPNNANSLLTLVYRTPQGSNIAVVSLPKKNGTIAYVDDVVRKTGDTMTGLLNVNSGVNTLARGADGFDRQWQNLVAPYLVDNGNANGNNVYYPFIKGINRNGNTWGTALSFGYETPDGINKFGRGCIHLIEDNGTQKLWRFEHNGDFNSAGDVHSSGGKSLNNAAQLSDFVYQKIGDFEVRKYPDGTMIQTNAVSFRGKHLSEQVYSFNWAVSFVSAPMVFGSVKSAQGYNIVDRFQTDMKNKSNGSTYHYYLYDPDTRQGDWDMQFLAIGRWK